MILNRESWSLGYSQILRDCRNGGNGADGENEEIQSGTVLILCHSDVDAIAAARIFCYMFRADNIDYAIRPCSSYTMLLETCQRYNASGGNSLVAVVLLNLGGNRNLTNLFRMTESNLVLSSSTKVYVLDSRKPVHLANVHAGDNVVVFWDSTQDMNDLPSDGDNLSANEDSSSDEDDSSDDESLSDDEGEHEFDMKADSKDTPETPPESDNDSHGGKSISSKASKPVSPPTMTPHDLHLQRRNRLRVYYSSGAFYGSPASFMAYEMCSQLRFGGVGDLLWFACVGVTDAYLHARLDITGYSALACHLKEDVKSLYPDDMVAKAENAVYAEHLLHEKKRKVDGTHRTQVLFSEEGKILAKKDYRLFLLHQSSLFDGMLYSDFISTNLQLWTPQGMQQLHELLAKMGYSLSECRQPFAFMKPSLRKRLGEEMRVHAEEHGLEDFEFQSFFRVVGYQSLVSASDASYAVAALLEICPQTGVLQESPVSKLEMDCFNMAFDALGSSVGSNSRNSAVNLKAACFENGDIVSGGSMGGLLGTGIRLSMFFQRRKMSTAIGLMTRNAITRLRHFRYAYITSTFQSEHQEDLISTSMMAEKNAEDTKQEEHHVFSKPLGLCRLAHYLMDMNRRNGKWTGDKYRPLVLLAEQPSTHKAEPKEFLVVGYSFPETVGHFVKNTFSQKFEMVAQRMELDRHEVFDSFDSNVVRVMAQDAQRFIEELHHHMDSV